MFTNNQFWSTTKYGEFLNVDNSTIHRYMISRGFLDEELNITSHGTKAGLVYKEYKKENESIKYVAYPFGLIDEDEIIRMQ